MNTETLDIITTLINWGEPPVVIYNVCRRLLNLGDEETWAMMQDFGLTE